MTARSDRRGRPTLRRPVAAPASAFLAPAALALAVLLTGCGPGGDSDQDDVLPGTPSRDPVEPSGLVWAADGTVHLGDGATIDTDAEIDSYVVAGDGVYFVPETEQARGEAELMLATPDGVEATGLTPAPESLTASEDGRFLALLDNTDEKDGFDTPLVATVIIDLDEGTEVLRSNDGMGDPGRDDLADLYEELPPAIHGITDDLVHVATTDDVRSIDLATGEVTQTIDSTELNDQDWLDELETPAWDNPGGTWSILARTDRPPVLLGPQGQRVRPRLNADRLGLEPWEYDAARGVEWSLDGWVDDTTAVGTARAFDDRGSPTPTVLVTCTVSGTASGTNSGTDSGTTCEPVAGTEDGVVLPNNRRLVTD